MKQMYDELWEFFFYTLGCVFVGTLILTIIGVAVIGAIAVLRGLCVMLF